MESCRSVFTLYVCVRDNCDKGACSMFSKFSLYGKVMRRKCAISNRTWYLD